MICISYFMTGGPGKEHRANNPPPTASVQKRSKRDTTYATTSQNPSHWPPSWLSNACTTRKDPESEQLDRDNPESNLIAIKPKTSSHTAEQLSWVLTLLLSVWEPLPNKGILCRHVCLLGQFISGC